MPMHSVDGRQAVIVSGTGHRPDKLGGYAPAAQERVVRTAVRSLELIRPEKVITGMALGWDQALAEAARRLGIPYIAAVPFPGQDCKWPEVSRAEFARLLEAAAEVVTVCEGPYAPVKMQLRNEWMVDHCDLVLALWNGSSGGTGNCVSYAHSVRRPVKNAWRMFTSL